MNESSAEAARGVFITAIDCMWLDEVYNAKERLRDIGADFEPHEEAALDRFERFIMRADELNIEDSVVLARYDAAARVLRAATEPIFWVELNCDPADTFVFSYRVRASSDELVNLNAAIAKSTELRKSSMASRPCPCPTTHCGNSSVGQAIRDLAFSCQDIENAMCAHLESNK